MHPPGAEHADLRRDLLPTRPRQETRRHGLPAERTGVVADDRQTVRQVIRQSATRAGTTTVVHHPREESLSPGAATTVRAGGQRRTIRQEGFEIHQWQRPQGLDPAETAREDHQLVERRHRRHQHHQETRSDTRDICIALGVAPGGQRADETSDLRGRYRRRDQHGVQVLSVTVVSRAHAGQNIRQNVDLLVQCDRLTRVRTESGGRPEEEGGGDQ